MPSFMAYGVKGLSRVTAKSIKKNYISYRLIFATMI